MRFALLLTAASVVYGQTFEVASVKAAPPPDGMGMRVGTTGGPGSKDPGRWTCYNMSLANLIFNAFNLAPYQLNGPDWIQGERFNIEAKVPEGATRDDLKKMIEHLLVERFGLKFHREQKEMQGYELVVAKGGPKLKESEPLKEGQAPPVPVGGPPRFTMGKNGFPELPEGMSMMMMMNGKAAKRGVRESIDLLARNLAGQVGKPVTDATGLKGKYDYTLYWVSGNGPAAPPPAGADGAIPVASDDGGPTIFNAIQEQLGLKLEARKTTVEMLVVDKVEKTPTEN